MIFLSLTILSILIQGAFALFEMAILSVSRVRLQYYAAAGKKRAIWLSALLKSPSQFFGAILIGINGALQIGSECSRKFYEEIHIDPSFAPVTQVFLVMILGELVPMFIARRHPSQISLWLAPVMIVFARILFPITWGLDLLSRGVQRLFGSPKEVSPLFSREEIAVAFQERGEGEDDLHTLTEKIFQFKHRTVGQIMTPLDGSPTTPLRTTIADVTEILRKQFSPVLTVYQGHKHKIVGMLHVRDMLKLSGDQPIFGITKPPWFVTKGSSLLEILEQFRRNNQSMAVVIDPSLQACGTLTLDTIVSELFGKEQAVSAPEPLLYIERTLSGDMTLGAFNREFHAALPGEADTTLSDWILSQVGHPPAIQEMVRFDPFVFTVEELTLRGVSVLSVRSL